MEHTRIDEGVKRGPKSRNGMITRPSNPADLGTWEIPADLNPDDVIRRYLTESTTSQIAQEYGLSRKAMTQWLRTVRKDQWKQAQIVRALAIKEDSEDGMAVAPDALSLARARELLKASQFDLTALDEDYRPKTDVRVEIVGDLGERLRRSKERTIEHDAGQQTVELAQVQQLPKPDVT